MSQTPEVPPNASSGNAPSRLWAAAAVAVLGLAAVAATLTCVWNYDVFWHLAAGRWMLEHGRILTFDPFSIDPEPRWVNVHWGFQVLITLLHSVGGFGILSVLKALLAGATLVIFALALRRSVPPGWLIFSGLAMLVISAGRIRVRPEAFSLAFVMLTVVLLESVRRGADPKRLWWLVPIMLVWVNMHGLYILGMGITWAAMIGAAIDRKLRRDDIAGKLPTRGALAPIVAATVAVLVTPWPVEAALHPVLLWTRISGQAFYYTYGVSELRPTWEAPGRHVEAIVFVLLAATVMVLNRRRLPAAHAIWLVAFVALAALARRNVGLMGPAVGYLLAWHGGGAIRRIVGGRKMPTRVGPCSAAAMTLVTLALGFAAATGHLRGYLGWARQLGVGLQEYHYPVAAAKFLRQLPAKGDLLCENFGDAGTFIYHSYPKRLLYMDGRLEAHSRQRFIDLYRINKRLRTADGAEKVELPPSVRFIFVNRKSFEKLGAMAQSRRFQLVFLDPAGACFARRDWYAGTSALPGPNFEDYDRPLDRDLLVQGFGAERPRWYARNPLWRNFQLGEMFLSLGQPAGRGRPKRVSRTQQKCLLLAIRFLTAAQTEGLLPADVLNGTLAQAYQRRALQFDVIPSATVPVDVNSARALALYERTRPSRLSGRTMRMFAMDHIVAMLQARHLDDADEAVRGFLEELPPREQVHTPREFLELREEITRQLDLARTRGAGLDNRRLALLKRIDRLTSPQIGLIAQAILELRAAGGDDPEVQLRLGDLLLRRGKTAEARKSYAKVDLPPGENWRLALRLALCDWVDGKLFTAADAMEELAADDRPVVSYYRALLLEQLGRYEEAAGAIATARGTDATLAPLIERLRRRLGAK